MLDIRNMLKCLVWLDKGRSCISNVGRKFFCKIVQLNLDIILGFVSSHRYLCTVDLSWKTTHKAWSIKTGSLW